MSFFVCNTAEYAVIVVWSRTEKISEISESSRNARNPSVDASTHSPIIRTIEKQVKRVQELQLRLSPAADHTGVPAVCIEPSIALPKKHIYRIYTALLKHKCCTYILGERECVDGNHNLLCVCSRTNPPPIRIGRFSRSLTRQSTQHIQMNMLCAVAAQSNIRQQTSSSAMCVDVLCVERKLKWMDHSD